MFILSNVLVYELTRECIVVYADVGQGREFALVRQTLAGFCSCFHYCVDYKHISLNN